MHLFPVGTAAYKVFGLIGGGVIVAASEIADVIPTVIADTSKIGLLTVGAWQILREIKKSSTDRLAANDTALAVYQRLAVEAEDRADAAEDRADEAEERLRVERASWAAERADLERTIQQLKGHTP